MNGTSTASARVSARAAISSTVRKARAQVKIPEAYIELAKPLTVTPDEVEEAFVEANPGLTRKGIAVTCDSRRLQRGADLHVQGSRASAIAPRSTGAPAAATGW